MKIALLLVSATATAVIAQQIVYGQCGGIGWTGLTTCVSGTYCIEYNPWYFQCIPGTASTTSTTSISSKPSPSSTSKTALTTTSVHTGSKSTTSTSKPTTSASVTVISTTLITTTSTASATTTGIATATLQSGYYWIRAVESPNFHSYLQTSPTAVPGTAILASYLTAGQFQIVSGQLVEKTPTGLLYANVENPANITGYVKLGMSFNTTQNSFGTFAFSGDAVQWSSPTVSRPNLSAWLVCENQDLYINLGNYAYMTPAGCVDETIHYYNGATANGGN